MVSIALPRIRTEQLDATCPGGLGNAAYLKEVLRLPPETLEDELDDELIARAQQLGISTHDPQTTDDDDLDSDKRHAISLQSASTAATHHARTFSTTSRDSTSTSLTTNSSVFVLPISDSTSVAGGQKQHFNPINFHLYDMYLAQLDKALDQPNLCLTQPSRENVARSIFSVSTRRNLINVTLGIRHKIRLRRKSTQLFTPSLMRSCNCCRDEFHKSVTLHNLPCGHACCVSCLQVMIGQSMMEESRMPPRCCAQPLPASIIKDAMTPETQQAFLRAVVQFSTPWEERIFCPNVDCRQFIPPRRKVDPKQPLSVTCRTCRSRACVTCKRSAHALGEDCPYDWELEAALKKGDKPGWRRCYKCRELVELTPGCTRMTCSCTAQFCYICGGVWDPSAGCPSLCKGEEELEKQRLEEVERIAKLEAAKVEAEAIAMEEAARRKQAEERSRHDESFQHLVESQTEEMQRFLQFFAKEKMVLQEHHDLQRKALEEKHDGLIEKTKERHLKAAGQLEDRQVAAEMELRSALEQHERSVKIRLKHMEAYCNGLALSPGSDVPQRTITERDLRELGQQYDLRDNMERLHQSKINVMRDRQAKRMEELLDRQETELDDHETRRQEELDGLMAQHAQELGEAKKLCRLRRDRLRQRWKLSMEVLCKETEARENLSYAPIPGPQWPDEDEAGEAEGKAEGEGERKVSVDSGNP